MSTSRFRISRRSLLAASAAALAIGPWTLAAHAQSGTVRFILPNAAGSGVDAITRAAQPALSKAFGASVIVDNQPGAGGIVGLMGVAIRLYEAATERTFPRFSDHNPLYHPWVSVAMFALLAFALFHFARKPLARQKADQK